MRFISLCTVLSAALVSAAPCKPVKPTTTLESSATFATTSVVETSTAETATAAQTTLETTITTEAPTDATTVLETTITETATETGATATSAATTETTAVEATTTTVSEEPEPTNFLRNGGFEDKNNVDWDVRTAQIVKDAAKAHSGEKFVQLAVTNSFANGGNQFNQTINGLNTERLFRLKFSSATFGNPVPSQHVDTCKIEALKDGLIIGSWPVDTINLNEYQDYEMDFVIDDEDMTLSMRIRCDPNYKVTVTVGIDDVSVTDAGEAPEPPAPTN
ncbi:hypothetical protein FHETE_7025 [Fusarium heterosporum]|uniref:Uncharacterized protein n=1 Tax=Fusarium heterosporum TaxID=42747 RepID=A0A8H5T2F7_FUSHE|nr:hypothetical protein FHETE_7025 [Fusarium heterosporum]